MESIGRVFAVTDGIGMAGTGAIRSKRKSRQSLLGIIVKTSKLGAS